MGKGTEDPGTYECIAEARVSTKTQKRFVGQRLNSFDVDTEATGNA